MKTQKLSTFRKFVNSQILTTGILSLLLGFSIVALADYVPSPDQEPTTDYTKSGGSRGLGCPDLVALASRQYVVQTTSVRPTFVWYISQPKTVQFFLSEFDKNGEWQPISDPINVPSSTGITKLTFKEDFPELTVGKKYRWQVATDCSEGDVIDLAEFTVVQMPANLSQQLSQTADETKKAELYASANLWYDALAEALKLAPEGKLGNLGSAFLQDLAKWEVPQSTPPLEGKYRKAIEQKIKDLKKVAIEQK